MGNGFCTIFTDTSSLNSDGAGICTVYIADDATALAALPTVGDTFSGPRPGSLALCLNDAQNRKAWYILSAARDWEFLREVL